jgi:hypothetical protein
MPASDVIERRRRQRNNNILQFPDDLGAHAMLMLFRNYEYVKPGVRRLNRVSDETLSTSNLSGMDNIMVPLPSNIADKYSVRLSRFDQEVTGDLVSTAAAGIGGVDTSVGEAANQVDFGQLIGAASESLPSFGGAVDAVKQAFLQRDVGKLSRDAAFLARRTIDKQFSGLSRNLDAGFGNVINPKAALYFDGVEMKTHTFNWSFTPRSESESTAIRDIGNVIKKNILPSYGDVGGYNRVLLNYPSTVDIFFFGIDQSYFMFFKTCMVQSFDIDFSPQGLAFVKGGKPATVTMAMNLMETDIHTSEDYGGEGTIEPDQTAADIQNVLSDRSRGIARGF